MTTLAADIRPFWLTGDCPDWCAKDHLSGDIGQERHHADHGATIHLTLHDGWGSLSEPQPVHLGLFQGPREVEPYVELFWPPRDAVIRFTLTEAAGLASYISAALTAANPQTTERSAA